MTTPPPSPTAEPTDRRRETLALVLATVAVFVTRWWLHPAYLWDWDAVAFADALHHFDVTCNQPHPPGFLLFVLAGRLAYALLHDEAAALCLVSAACSAAGVPLLAALGRRWLAPAERRVWLWWWVTQPVFWFYGALPLTYAAESLVVLGLLVLLTRPRPAPALVCGLLFGLAGGVRVSTWAMLGLPLLWLLRGWRPAQWLTFAGGFAVGVAAWLAPTAWLSGGWHAFRTCNSCYGYGFFWSESLVTGNWAGSMRHLVNLAHNGVAMFGPGLVLLALGAAAWPRSTTVEPAARVPVALWLAGGLGYLVVFHMGQPGYLLALMPAAGLLLVAALRLAWRLFDHGESALSWERWGHRVGAGLLVAWNLAAFAAPDGPFTTAALRGHDAQWARLTRSVRAEFAPEDTLLLHFGMFRQAAWYLPEYRHVIPTLICRYPRQFPLTTQNLYQSQHRRIEPARWFFPSGFAPQPLPLTGVRRLVVLDATATWVYQGREPLRAWPAGRGFCWVLEVPAGATLVYDFGRWEVVAPTKEFGAGR